MRHRAARVPPLQPRRQPRVLSAPDSLAPLLERSEGLRLARAALGEYEPWLVGGTVRDLLMGRAVTDLDLVVAGDPEAAARRLARAAAGPVFPLSERFGAWRVLATDRSWQADLTPVRGGAIEADLTLRDFTINAMAVPLAQGAPLLDPHGGLADLEHGIVRMVGERSYVEDPLRTLRMARFACELGFEVEGETRRLASVSAGAISQVAPERIFYELRKLIVSADVLRGLELMDDAGLVALLLGEVEALKGVEQNPYHHLDAWGHTLAVLACLIDLERDPEPVFGELSAAIADELERPLADELTRWQALRLGALLHDIGKPGTRRVTDDGRILFWGHDELGAEMSRAFCSRMRTSAALADFLAGIAQHHLRLGFLVHERPLSRRHVYRYLSACSPIELEVTVLSVADRLGTRGERTRQDALEAHLELARDLAEEALAWRSTGRPQPLVGGEELMRELGLEPGPRVGELLELVREAAFAGEVTSSEEALELARRELK
jgi:poly(A) polymerase